MAACLWESPDMLQWKLPSFLKCLGLVVLFASLCPTLPAQMVSPLGSIPDWSLLDDYQETISRETFQRLLDTVYAPNSAAAAYISVGEDGAAIRQKAEDPDALYFLKFAKEDLPSPSARFWRPIAELNPVRDKSRPLEGVRIALDPGHIGGDWARMEERWFQIGDAPPVEEGEMVLKVADHISAKLRKLGAIVTYTRTQTEPVTRKRPEDFLEIARQSLTTKTSSDPVPNPPPDAPSDFAVRKSAEMLFYRTSEIRERALLINDRLRPDLVLCIHFNAEAWGDPEKPILLDRHHLHLLVNGTYSHAELRLDDVRFEMLLKLLDRSHEDELALSEAVALAMHEKTGLPPYRYTTPNATELGETGFVWGRNLLANRLFLCPVVFLEPYVMNSRQDYARIQAGDYEGLREFPNLGKRPSIYREYADSVVSGVLDYFEKKRPKAVNKAP